MNSISIRASLIALACFAPLLSLAPAALAQNAAPAPGQNAPSPQTSADLAFWNSVKDSKNASEYKAYLAAFPDGIFAPLARMRMNDMANGVSNPTPSPAPTPQVSNTDGLADLTDPTIIREVQLKLFNLNYDMKRQDGVFDPATQLAIRGYQQNIGVTVTGSLTNGQLAKLRASTPPNQWAAIAYTARGASGIAYGRPSRQDAIAEAISNCRRKAGRRADCSVISGFDKTCIAMATYRETYRRTIYFGAYTALRSDMAGAISKALQNCNEEPKSNGNCAVRTTICGDGSNRK